MKILIKLVNSICIQDLSKNEIENRVKHPLLERVPSLARFFDNLIEITRVKDRVVEFFFH